MCLKVSKICMAMVDECAGHLGDPEGVPGLCVLPGRAGGGVRPPLPEHVAHPGPGTGIAHKKKCGHLQKYAVYLIMKLVMKKR